MDENTLSDSSHTKSFEEEIQNSLNGILASDDGRRASFQLAYEEEQQIVAVSTYFFNPISMVSFAYPCISLCIVSMFSLHFSILTA